MLTSAVSDLMKFFTPSLALLFGFLVFSGCSGPQQDKDIRGNPEKPLDKIEELSEKISQDTTNATLYGERAKLYLGKKMANEALRDLRKAILIDPGQADNYLTLSDAYLMMGKLPNCLEALQKAERLDPKDNEAVLKLAEVYLIMEDYDNTFAYVKKALSLDTKNPRAYFIRGYALMEKGDTVSAIRNMQNAFDQDPHYYEAAVQLGLLYSYHHDPLAEEYYKTAIGIDPNKDAAYYLLGLYYQETGKMTEAVDTYDKLLTIDPEFKEAYYNIGYIDLVHFQDFKHAAEYFTKAIQQDPQYLDAWFNRGYSYELSGNYQDARKDYQKALQIKPNYDRAVEGLNRLDKLENQK